MKVWVAQINGHYGYDYIYVASTEQRVIDEIWHHFNRTQDAQGSVDFPSGEDGAIEEVTLDKFKEDHVRILDALNHFDEIYTKVTIKHVLNYDGDIKYKTCDACDGVFPEDEVAFYPANKCSAGVDTWACEHCRRPQ